MNFIVGCQVLKALDECKFGKKSTWYTKWINEFCEYVDILVVKNHLNLDDLKKNQFTSTLFDDSLFSKIRRNFWWLGSMYILKM